MKKYISLFFLFFIAVSFGQRKFAADRYFKELSYVKSAELYEVVYKKGDSSQQVINRLADSYYFNNKSIDAEKWYQKLFKLYEKNSLDAENYFKYAQSLKMNGKYKESDAWLLKFNKLKELDSRGRKLSSNPNYFSKYSLDKEKFIHIKNLSINTPYSDFGTFIRDSIVVFASTRPKGYKFKNPIYSWNKQPYLDLFKSKEIVFSNDSEEYFSELSLPKRIENINTKYHDASAVITKDGKTIYFTRDNFNGKRLKKGKNDTSHLKIFKADWKDNQWINITELPFNNNNYSTGHPALSPDEKTLFFVSDMPNGFGKTDLYKVAILGNNTFGRPKNLGPTVNTEGKEMFPFLSNENVLYFSSDGHIGLGSLDVFETKINKDNSFSDVKNLASPINSKKDDFAFTLSKEGNRGYFSSNRIGGKGDDDIYSFVIRKKAPICNQLVEGVVTDVFTRKILPGSKVILFENKVKKDSLIVGVDAKYQFKIACNSPYKIEASKLFYINGVKTFISPKANGKTVQDIAINLENDFQYSNGQIVVKINPIYFDYNRSNIRKDASIELEKVIQIMRKYPTLILKSGSHTDSRGKNDYNLKLSTRRANSTVEYIISRGINSGRITGEGFGETKLLNKCSNGVKCSKDEHQLNRRTEFVVVVNSNVVISVNNPTFNEQKSIHKVVYGDTLFSIAKKNNISVESLKKLNNLKKNNIFVGQLLKLK